MEYFNIDDVVEFCKEELVIDKETKVFVYLEDLTEDGVAGWCHDDFITIEGEEIEYEIDIDMNLDPDEMLVTLCHEMVHVKQYTEGRLSDEDEAYKLENVLAGKYKRSLLAV